MEKNGSEDIMKFKPMNDSRPISDVGHGRTTMDY
jgi:hypothetical protein